MSAVSGWLAALRIARREARRAKGRTALVMALIGLPVLALSFAAVSYDMFTLTPQEQLAREIGTADARLTRVASGPVEQDSTGGVLAAPVEEGAPEAETETDVAAALPGLSADQVRALLPTASHVSSHWYGEVRASTATGVGTLRAEAFDLTDRLVEGIARVTDGRAPAGATEVAVTASAGSRLGVGVGDQLELVESDLHPAGRYRVTGLVEFPDRVATDRLARLVPPVGDVTGIDSAAIAYQATVVFHPDGQPGAGWQTDWLVATTEPVSWEQIGALNQHGVVAYARAVATSESPPAAPAGEVDGATFAAGVLIAGLAVLEIVLLAGPAFAVGARRRQRELALVAAGGGTPAQLRRIVLADGVVLGALGAAAGIALGIAAAFAARPLVETSLVGARAGGHRVFPLALLGIVAIAVGTGLLAALVPAYTAARQPVVAALAGRRGSTGVRRRWLLLGLAMVALGVAVAGIGAWRVSAPVVLAGLILGQLGLVLCTPSVIGLVSRLGSRLPLTPRIALRDTARNRSAAAPAVSAIMAAVMGAAAAGVVLLSLAESSPNWTGYPPGSAVAYGPWIQDGDGEDPVPDGATLAEVERAARATLPVDQVRLLSRLSCRGEGAEEDPCAQVVLPVEHRCPYWDQPLPLSGADQRAAARDPRCDTERDEVAYADRVDDGTALAALTGAEAADLAAAAAVLRDGGAVVTDHRLLRDGMVTLQAARFGPDGEALATEQLQVPGQLVPVDFRGLGPVLSPGVARALGATVAPGELLISTSRAPTQAEEDAFAAAMETHESFGWVVRDLDSGVAPGLILLAVTAGLIALGAAGIATGLAAADRRPDLATLAAVGASPRVRRGLALSQATVIAGLGTGLGLLAGLGAAIAALVALNQRYANTWPSPDPIPITVPWPNLAVLLAVPLVAMLGAGLLTRSRLPIERRPS